MNQVLESKNPLILSFLLTCLFLHLKYLSFAPLIRISMLVILCPYFLMCQLPSMAFGPSVELLWLVSFMLNSVSALLTYWMLYKKKSMKYTTQLLLLFSLWKMFGTTDTILYYLLEDSIVFVACYMELNILLCWNAVSRLFCWECCVHLSFLE